MNEDKKSLVKTLEEEAMPSVISGAIGALAANMVMGVGMNQEIPFFGMGDYPSWLVIGGTIAGSVLISEISHDTVLKWIPDNKYLNMENRLLAPVLAGGATYLLFRVGASEDTSLINSVVLGSGSAVAGKYISNTVMNKY